MTTKVTATDAETGEVEEVEIVDNYVLIREGSAYVSSTQLHMCKDGSVTHVITVKGCKR